MSLEWEQTIVDAHRDGRALGLWWRDALGWVVVNDDPDEFEIRPRRIGYRDSFSSPALR